MTALGPRGLRLRAALETQDPTLAKEDTPLREVAVAACLTADRVDRLQQLAVGVEPWINTDKGALITHPVLVEVPQQVHSWRVWSRVRVCVMPLSQRIPMSFGAAEYRLTVSPARGEDTSPPTE